MGIPSPFFCVSHSCQKEHHLWSCFLASHEDCFTVIHGSRAVIGPVEYKFTQTTLQLVSEDCSGSVLLGRSALRATSSHVKSNETPFVPK